VEDLTQPDPLEWEDVEAELCSTAREACAFGADWLVVSHPVAPGSGRGTIAPMTSGAPSDRDPGWGSRRVAGDDTD
jgi:hypothetical protein